MRPLLFLLFALLTSCQAIKGVGKKKARPPAKPSKPEAQQIGSVSLIHPDYSFVLIQTRKGFSLPDGTELKCYSPAGTNTAKLKSSSARQGSFITADITSGSPKKGDLVLHDPAGSLKPNMAKLTPVAPVTSPPSTIDSSLEPPLPEVSSGGGTKILPSVSASPPFTPTRTAPHTPDIPEQLPTYEPTNTPADETGLRAVPSIPLTTGEQ